MFIFEQLPWFETFLAWAVAGFVIWAVAAIPAYLIWRGIRTLHEQFSGWLGTHVKTLRFNRAAEAERLGEEARQAADRSDLDTIDSLRFNAWRQPIDATLAQSATLSSRLTDLTGATRSAGAEVASVEGRFVLLEQIWQQAPAVGTPSELTVHTTRRRLAWAQLLTGMIFLVPVILANAVLSSMVLREVMPRVQTVFGPNLPLEYVLGLLLTLIEAGVGFLHGLAGERDKDDPRRLTLPLLVTTFLACAVVALETLLYGQFITESNSGFRLPGSEIVVAPGLAFALMGFVLGSTVFLLGRVIYLAGSEILRLGTAKMVARHLRDLKRAGGNWDRLLTELRASQERVLGVFREIRSTTEHQGTELATRFDADIALLKSLQTTCPDWARPTERGLSSREASERMLAAWVWCGMTALALAAAIATVTVGLGLAYPSLAGELLSLGIAVASALLFFGMGYTWGGLRHRDRQNSVTLGQAAEGRSWMLPLGVLVLFAILWFGAIWSQIALPRTRAIWLLSLIPMYLLLLCGSEMVKVAVFLRIVLKTLARFVVVLLSVPWIVFLHLVSIILSLLTHALSVIAWPVAFWFESRGTHDEAPV